MKVHAPNAGSTVSSYTSSSLTLRAVLKSAAGRTRMGAPAGRVAGLTSPAKAMCAAVAASRTPAVLIVPNDAEVERMTVDARFFVAALEGASHADVERAVLPFPSHEVDPYRGLKPHFDIASARARALHGMAASGCWWRPRRPSFPGSRSPSGCCVRR